MYLFKKLSILAVAIPFCFPLASGAVSTKDTVHQAVTTVESITKSSEKTLDAVKDLTADMLNFKTDIENILSEWEEAERRYGKGNVPKELQKNLTLKVRLATSSLNAGMFKDYPGISGAVNQLREDVYEGLDQLQGIMERIKSSPIKQQFDEMMRQKEALEDEIEALIKGKKQCGSKACENRLQQKINNNFNRLDMIIARYQTSKTAQSAMTQFTNVMESNVKVMRDHFIPVADKFPNSMVRIFYKFVAINSGAWSGDTVIASSNFRKSAIAFANLANAMNKSIGALDQASSLLRDDTMGQLQQFQEKIEKMPDVANSLAGETDEERLGKYRNLKLD